MCRALRPAIGPLNCRSPCHDLGPDVASKLLILRRLSSRCARNSCCPQSKLTPANAIESLDCWALALWESILYDGATTVRTVAGEGHGVLVGRLLEPDSLHVLDLQSFTTSFRSVHIVKML